MVKRVGPHRLGKARLQIWNASAPIYYAHMRKDCTHMCSPVRAGRSYLQLCAPLRLGRRAACWAQASLLSVTLQRTLFFHSMLVQGPYQIWTFLLNDLIRDAGLGNEVPPREVAATGAVAALGTGGSTSRAQQRLQL